MKCDLCDGEEAIIFVQQIAGSKAVELHLCAECAKKKGITASNGTIEFSVSNLLTTLLDGQKPASEEIKECPVCGTTLLELRKTGRLGCLECWTSFRPEIVSLLRKQGADLPHKGKYPKGILTSRSLVTDRENLKDKLRNAVEEEDYEAAASLRDRLKALERLPEGEA
jgi:protein arginine kinase activator